MDLPGYVNDFGEAMWTPGTVLTFAAVPWDATYRNIVDFETTDSVYDYVSKKALHVEYGHSTPIYPGKSIRLDIPYDTAIKYNYIVATNPALPGEWPNGKTDTPRRFFYFINDIEFVAPNTTNVVVQIDAWCTYIVGSNCQIGRFFLERGHAGIANNDQWEKWGQEYLAVPESLDIGSELLTAHTYAELLMTPGSAKIMVWASTCLDEDPGTVDDPHLKSAGGAQFQAVPNSLNLYIFQNVAEYMTAINGLKNAPWVTSGIQSVMAVNGDWVDPTDGFKCTIGGQGAWKVLGSPAFKNSRRITMIRDFRRRIRDLVLIRPYQDLDKFCVSPYTMIELTTYTGTPVLLKPELVDKVDLDVIEYASLCLPSPRVGYIPEGYGAWPNKHNWVYWNDRPDPPALSGGEDFDMATWISNLPQFSVLNDGYLNILAGQAHSLAYAAQSAEWVRDKSISGANLAYDQTGASIANNLQNNQVQRNLASQVNSIGNQAAWDSAGVSMGLGALGVAGSALSGNIGGVISGAAGIAATGLNTSIQTGANTARTSASNAASATVAGNNASLGNYVRDTNRAYANYAANGDYENTIAGINAKKQDCKLTQPTISGQAGGDNFMFAGIGMRLVAKIKCISASAQRRIGDYWLRYGYEIDRNVNFRVFSDNKSPYIRDGGLSLMKRFTYWKMREVSVGGDIPEIYKQTLRGILEKGVTVWKNPDDIIPADLYDNKCTREISLG